MAAPPTISLEEFTCSICREIFQNPVSLACEHCFCRRCVEGTKKPLSPPTTDLTVIPNGERSSLTSRLVYKPTRFEKDVCFVCAMCRAESFGFYECKDLQSDLETLEAPCANCNKSLALCELRRHSEKCVPPKKTINTATIKRAFTADLLKQLSAPQAKALEKARSGQNRSTFQCPYCERANFTIEHMCRHIEKHHLDENPRRVCPVCSSMPWGNQYQQSSNVYEHLLQRHRFDYSTYVKYDQDEEAMMAEAIERSMMQH
ncbi:unnamed protein product [Adineta ricciae]|uniref:RING-type E3 ubiquitin transferase n=1 Tax=Adineta ricciae TaxID=249248 RepID=A0A815F0S9_ADIRI|nr:unnamed protein product [Adineta ricciae]